MDVTFSFSSAGLYVWAGLTIGGLIALVYALRLFESNRHQRLSRFVSAGLAPRLLPGYDSRLRRPLFWCTVLGFALLGLALAQPHWGREWREVQKFSRDVVVCLDVSPSMLAENPLPNRLERARQKIVELADRMPGDRFALVAFAGAAQTQCPLTLDHGYFKAVLRACDTDSISARGTNIADAIDTAMKTFREEEIRTGEYGREHRAILIVSDGEQVSGDVLKVAESASETATIYVMGVGDPNGAEVELPRNFSRAMEPGSQPVHLSKLDEDTLIKVATYGSGRYVRLQPDSWDIEQLSQHMGQQAARFIEGDVRSQLVNRYQWPLFAAIAFFMAEGIWLAIMPHIRARREAKQKVRDAGESYV